jgi:ATP-dependent DNA ligase
MIVRTTPKKKKQTMANATFIETMDCLPVSKVPEGPEWTYEIKLDGYRLEAVKHKGKVTVYSRRHNVLNQKFGSPMRSRICLTKPYWTGSS